MAKNKTNKKKRFNWFKMWTYYILASYVKDYGKIPDNIGDRILITNNMMITRRYLSTAISIEELGEETPKYLVYELDKALREKGNTALMDFTFKTRKYTYDPKDSGLEARIRTWENGLSDETQIPQRMKHRYARLLYTAHKAMDGEQIYHLTGYIVLKSPNAKMLSQAEKIISQKLWSYGCVIKPIKAMLKPTMQNLLICSNTLPEKIARPKTFMGTVETISQMCPATGAINDTKGVYMGINIENGTPYYIDFDSVSGARIIYALSPSGGGKTAIATTMLQSAFENGSDCVIMDIKGNEYTAFCNAAGGITISLRQDSTEYINSWVMHKEDLQPGVDPSLYYNSRIAFSVQQMIVLSGVKDAEEKILLEGVINKFMENFYARLGVTAANMNSWALTNELNPFVVYDAYKTFVQSYVDEGVHVARKSLIALDAYFLRSGARSYIFTEEFNYTDVYNSRVVVFDFGMLQADPSDSAAENVYRLKLLYMSKLNGEKMSRTYSEGRRTFKILEESQIVSEEVMEFYAQEITLRRSQRQDTLLIGNSIKALEVSNSYSKALIENIRGLLLGELTADARDKIMDTFDIHEFEDYLMLPGSDLEYKYSFTFINKMQDKRLYPVLKVVKPNMNMLVPTKTLNKI